MIFSRYSFLFLKKKILVLYSTISAWIREFSQDNISGEKKADGSRDQGKSECITINESKQPRQHHLDSSFGMINSFDLGVPHIPGAFPSTMGRRRHQSLLLVQEVDVVDYVSPYTIRNSTGYQIEIERDYGMIKVENSKKTK